MSKIKFISALVLIVYIVSLFPVISLADESEIYFGDSFDNYVTNEKPSVGTIKGLNSRIYEHKAGADKAMALKATPSKTSFSYTAPESLKEFVLSLDINPLNAVPKGTITLGTGSTAINIANFDSSGRLTCFDGKVMGGIISNRFTKLTFSMDLSSRRCDIYVNEKCVLSNWYLGASSPKSISGISMEFSVGDNEEPVEVLIDNLYLYKGTDIIPANKLPKSSYNPNSVEFAEEVELVSDQVFINRTFDEENAGDFDSLRVQPGTYNKIKAEEEKDGNRYMEFTRLGDGDCYVDLLASSPSPKLVMEFSLKGTSNQASAFMFLRDSNSKDSYLFRLTDEGELQTYYGNSPITKISKTKWTHISVLFNFTEGIYDLYVDYKLVMNDQTIPDKPADYTFFRLGCSGYDTSLKMDNIKLYDGVEIREIEEEQGGTELPSVMPTYADIPAKLSGFVALQLYGGTFFAKGERTNLEAPAYTRNDRTMVPVRVISEGFGLTVNWDEANKKVTIGSDIEMTIGSDQMKTANGIVKLETAPEITNGRTFLPLRAFAEDALGKKVFWDDRGLIVIGDREFTERASSLINVNNYMLFDRPDAETLLDIFSTTGANKHPRVMATKETFDRIRRDYNANHHQLKPWCDEIIASANQYIGVPPLESDYVTDGQFLTISRAIQIRIETLSMAYQLTGDKKYVDRVWVEVEKSGNFDHWNTVHYLDTAHMMAAFAVAYDWNYDQWTPQQLKFMEEKMIKYGLNHSNNEYHRPGCWWPVVNINWNPVCNGSTLMAAAALLDAQPEFCASLIENAIRGVEFAVNEFYPSGSWPEGATYGQYTIQHFVKMLSTLDATFGSDFNISDAAGFSLAPLDAIYNNGHVASNNYHDSGSGLVTTDETFWIADKFNIPAYANITAAYIENGQSEVSVSSVLYYNTDKVSESDNLPIDRYFVGTEAGSMRSSWDDATGVYIGFHGGNAIENHGHIDSGTFVVDMSGERLICDIGAADYFHPEYFGARRYDFYKTRPEGHNMVVINPGSTPGLNNTSYSPIIRQDSKSRGAITVMDLSEAYDHAKDYKRAYIMDDDRRSVIIRDEIQLKKEFESYWFMHTAGDIEIKDQNTAVITLNNKKFLVKVITDAPEYELTKMNAQSLPTSPILEGQNFVSGYQKISIKFKASGKVYVAVKIIPYDDPLADREFENIPIDEWTIPDGDVSLQRLPKPDMLYVDGLELEGFNNIESVYTVNIPKGGSVPAITAACSENVSYEITNAGDASGVTTVKFINKTNPELYKYYKIFFREISVTVAPIEGYTRHEVSCIYASSEPQSENNALNVFDGDIGTTWAFTGRGEYLKLDLGTSKPINAIALAAGRGDTRSLYYSIDVSENGSDWTNIYNGATEFTNELRIIDIPETTARYVKFVLNDNSTNNNWSAVTEFGPLYR